MLDFFRDPLPTMIGPADHVGVLGWCANQQKPRIVTEKIPIVSETGDSSRGWGAVPCKALCTNTISTCPAVADIYLTSRCEKRGYSDGIPVQNPAESSEYAVPGTSHVSATADKADQRCLSWPRDASLEGIEVLKARNNVSRRERRPEVRTISFQQKEGEFLLEQMKTELADLEMGTHSLLQMETGSDLVADFVTGIPPACSLALAMEAQRCDLTEFGKVNFMQTQAESGTSVIPTQAYACWTSHDLESDGSICRKPDSIEERCSGSVRVLLVTGDVDDDNSSGGCSVDVSSGNNKRLSSTGVWRSASPMRGGLDSALRLEQWCKRCGIMDVTPLKLPRSQDAFELAETLSSAARALGERCMPGDVCVLHLAISGLDEFEAIGDRDKDSVRLPAVGRAKDSLLAHLPEICTLVCVSDSHRGLELLGLGEATLSRRCQASPSFKAVLLLLGAHDAPGDACGAVARPPRSRSAGLCATALLRAVDALSLADGPCSLSCRDFLAELGQQAQELAEAAQLPPPRVIVRAYPCLAVANEVSWPLARLPRNQAGKDSERLRQPCTVASQQRASVPPQAISLSRTSSERVVNGGASAAVEPNLDNQPLGHQRISPNSGGARRTRRSLVPEGTEAAKVEPNLADQSPLRQRIVSKGVQRRGVLPTDLNGLAVVLSGGGVVSRGRPINKKDAQGRRHPCSLKNHSGRRRSRGGHEE
eukprot:TRINITY_DN38323_c0_g1_i1.p1 TRINITY_DN38323_c0_g1~~TRINITY_DN38323_c0_g1_i1.p1  ORF type:complete len:707 (+),score=84.10 TRINITY_DN38323_c0_g1_i1:258-2378(+)